MIWLIPFAHLFASTPALTAPAPPGVAITPAKTVSVEADGTYILTSANQANSLAFENNGAQPLDIEGADLSPHWNLAAAMTGAYHVSLEYSASDPSGKCNITIQGGSHGRAVVDRIPNTMPELNQANSTAGAPLQIVTLKKQLRIDEKDSPFILTLNHHGAEGAFKLRRIVLTPVAPHRKAARKPVRGFHVTAYLPEYRVLTVSDTCITGVTDLIFFSIAPTRDGGIDPSRMSPAIEARLKDIRTKSQVPMMVAFGGGDRSETFAAMATDPGRRRLFILDLVQFLINHGFDGVDYDWEFPDPPAEHAALSSLIVETKQALEPYGLQVSSAVAPWDEFTKETYAAVDQLNLMTYFDNHYAPISNAIKDTEDLIKKGADPKKICMGIPFYGEMTDGKGDGPTYAEVAAKYHPAPDQDLVNGIAFNGPATVGAKTDFAAKRHLRGVMIWELGQDTPDGTLISAVKASAPTESRDRNGR